MLVDDQILSRLQTSMVRVGVTQVHFDFCLISSKCTGTDVRMVGTYCAMYLRSWAHVHMGIRTLSDLEWNEAQNTGGNVKAWELDQVQIENLTRITTWLSLKIEKGV